jgi:hypothetical protein
MDTNTNWNEIANYDGFVKWSYRDTPYRVVAHFREERGHWEALFTSVYPGSYLIRGNAGGGNEGRTLAVAAAKQFMEQNNNGCPPPGQYE